MDQRTRQPHHPCVRPGAARSVPCCQSVRDERESFVLRVIERHFQHLRHIDHCFRGSVKILSLFASISIYLSESVHYVRWKLVTNDRTAGRGMTMSAPSTLKSTQASASWRAASSPPPSAPRAGARRGSTAAACAPCASRGSSAVPRQLSPPLARVSASATRRS